MSKDNTLAEEVNILNKSKLQVNKQHLMWIILSVMLDGLNNHNHKYTKTYIRNGNKHMERQQLIPHQTSQTSPWIEGRLYDTSRVGIAGKLHAGEVVRVLESEFDQAWLSLNKHDRATL